MFKKQKSRLQRKRDDKKTRYHPNSPKTTHLTSL